MNYKACAELIYNKIGGSENLISVAHCATRLRLVLNNEKKINKKEVEDIDGVKGVFIADGQLQIILGTGVVNKVYDEFVKISGVEASTKEQVKADASKKGNIIKRGLKIIGDIFISIIPAIVASGLIMGLLEGLSKAFPALNESGTFAIFSIFANAAFTFLPILIAVSAAKAFGGNLFLGAVIGMIMIHPNLLNAWNVASTAAGDIPTASVWFGLYNINLVGYQGHVIPVIFAVWMMSVIEKWLHKIVPSIIDLFVTPLVTVCVTGYLTLTVIGPVFSTLENWVLTAVGYIITIPFGIGSFLMGGLYATTVVTGLHHMYNAIEAGMLSKSGTNTWMPIATAANVAQGAAALAVAIKAKSKKVKALALPSSLSAFLGITEPAIFGVNIRYIRPFIAGSIGGAFGAMTASILNVGASAYGVTGLFGFLITTDRFFGYLLTMAVSFTVAFVISWFMGIKEDE